MWIKKNTCFSEDLVALHTLGKLGTKVLLLKLERL